MPDLLLELFSEEIPARMQAKAADDLRRQCDNFIELEELREVIGRPPRTEAMQQSRAPVTADADADADGE